MTGAGLLEVRYRLEGELGRGGFGRVVAGRRRADDRAVAIKLALGECPAAARDRVEREARLIAALVHPGLVGLLELAPTREGRLALVYERVDGRGLDQVLREGPLGVARALEWVRQLAAALDALHDAGMLHRDLKPANVMVEPSGRLRLIDYGLLKPEESGQTLTAEGLLFGTPQYMAPELARQARASRASDLYSLACVAWELLAGRPPFGGGSPMEVLDAHARDPIPCLPERIGTPALDQAFRSFLAKDPGARPARAGELAAALAAAAAAGEGPGPDRGARTRKVEAGSGSSIPAPGPEPSPAPARGAAGWAGPLSLAGALVVGVGWVVWGGGADAPDPRLGAGAGVLGADPQLVRLFPHGVGPWTATALRANLAAREARRAVRQRWSRVRDGMAPDPGLARALEALGGAPGEIGDFGGLLAALATRPGGPAAGRELLGEGWRWAARALEAAARAFEAEPETAVELAYELEQRFWVMRFHRDGGRTAAGARDRLRRIEGLPAEVLAALVAAWMGPGEPGVLGPDECARLLPWLRRHPARPVERAVLAMIAIALLLPPGREGGLRGVALDPGLVRELRSRLVRFALEDVDGVPPRAGALADLELALAGTPGEDAAEAGLRERARAQVAALRVRLRGERPGADDPERSDDPD